MAEIDVLIEAFHENINDATGKDGQYLLPQFEEIKNLFYGTKEEPGIELSKEEEEHEAKRLEKYYSEPGYKGD